MAEEITDEWTVKANDAITVSLVAKSEQGPPKTIASFHPTWTYPIVGDSETIYGYKGLKINLRYNASDMRPHLSHSSAKRVPEDEACAEVDDVNDLLDPYLPPVAFGKKADFEGAVQNTPDDWHPPGQLIETYDDGPEDQYEVWKGNLNDPLVLAMVKRIQILVPLLIEAGTPIQLESTDEHEADPLDRWNVYFLYHKRPLSEQPGKFTYVFAGYSTVYRFYIFRPQTSSAAASGNLELPTDTKPFSEFPCRSRISQFIILEPFQHKGNGQRLYRPIYRNLLEDPNTFEITVEDPSEAFDVLRDMADLASLREQPEFQDIHINKSIDLPKKGPVPKDIVDKKKLEAVRLNFKIAPRQFSRLTEMHLMSKLPDSVRPSMRMGEDDDKGKQAVKTEEEHEYRLWKVLTKSRINMQNKEILSSLEPGERITKLNETLASVELEYALLLSMFEQRQKAHSKSSEGKKRKLEEDGDEALNGKRARIKEA